MEIALLIVGLAVGIAGGYFITRYVANSSTKRAHEEAEQVVSEAKRQAETMRREAVVEAKDEVFKMKQEAQAEHKERMKEVRAAEKSRFSA